MAKFTADAVLEAALAKVATCQALTSGGTVDVPAYDIEFADVTP